MLVPVRWPDLEAAVQRHEIDVAMSGVTVRADRLLVGRFTSAVAETAAVLVAQPAPAQELQSGKPIRLIVALSPGGGTDVTARLVAQKMSQSMGMNVMVENKTGGNFIPAGREVLTAAPDGHTLYFISTSSLITQAMFSDYPFDITKFTPVTEAATGPLILVVKNQLGIKTLKELIDHAKANPGKLSFGAGGGTGSSLYFATELLKSDNIEQNVIRAQGARAKLEVLEIGLTIGQLDERQALTEYLKCVEDTAFLAG